ESQPCERDVNDVELRRRKLREEDGIARGIQRRVRRNHEKKRHERLHQDPELAFADIEEGEAGAHGWAGGRGRRRTTSVGSRGTLHWMQWPRSTALQTWTAGRKTRSCVAGSPSAVWASSPPWP